MIDAHIHLIGTGAGGTGCWLHRRGVQRALEGILLRQVGLTVADLDRDFDALYVERLIALVRGAGLSRVLILAQEDVYAENGQRIPDKAAFYVPNSRVLELARKYPEFVPAVSIHPARRDALDELERCLDGGAAVMKCLPNCQNIDPSLPQYRRFWERMAEAGLPLLAHTGGEKVLPETRRELANPRVHAVPLEIGVKVIAAHCGTSSSKAADFFPTFVEMLAKYPRLYGDTSALSFPRKHRHVARMLQPDVVSRLIHGSDFPVPVQPIWMWLGRKLSWGAYRKLRRMKNPLARDVAMKRALGFPEETFTRIEQIWRRPTST